MIKVIFKHPIAVLAAILLHLLIVGLFVLSFDWAEKPEVVEAGIPVSIVLPDTDALEERTNKANLDKKTIKFTKELKQENEKKRLASFVAREAELKAREDNEKIKTDKLLAKQKALKKKEAQRVKKIKEKKLAEEKLKQEQEKQRKKEVRARQEEKAKKKALAKKEKLAKLAAKKEAKEKAKRKAEKKKKAERLAIEKKAKKEKMEKERAVKMKAEKLKAERIAKEKVEAKKAAAKKKAEKEAAEKLAAKKAEYHRKWREAQEKKKIDAIAAEAKKKALAQSAKNKELLVKAKRGAQLSWGNRIQRHVKRRWHPPPGTSGKSARVKITISASGYIASGIRVLSCDGRKEFCASVIDAFERAEPLPRPPGKYNFNQSDRTITFIMD